MSRCNVFPLKHYLSLFLLNIGLLCIVSFLRFSMIDLNSNEMVFNTFSLSPLVRIKWTGSVVFINWACFARQRHHIWRSNFVDLIWYLVFCLSLVIFISFLLFGKRRSWGHQVVIFLYPFLGGNVFVVSYSFRSNNYSSTHIGHQIRELTFLKRTSFE